MVGTINVSSKSISFCVNVSVCTSGTFNVCSSNELVVNISNLYIELRIWVLTSNVHNLYYDPVH